MKVIFTKKSILVLAGLAMIAAGLVVSRATNAQSKKISPRTASSAAKREVSRKAAEIRALRAGAAPSVVDPCTTTVPITMGQTINGSLASGDCVLSDSTFIDFYSFSGQAGQAIFVAETSTQLDTYLYFLDDTGTTIDENEDSGSSTDSRVPVNGGVITLPYTGTFVIGANSSLPGSGNYALSVGTQTACAPTAIVYNQTVNGSLAPSDCQVNIQGQPFYTDIFTFQGTTGQQISIAANSSAVDSYLILHTPSGTGSVEDDDGGGSPNSRIPVGSGLFTLPETGTYTIELSSFNPFEVGAYTLVLSGPNAAPPAAGWVDFDGDQKTDISIFRPSVSEWWLVRSSNGSNAAAQFGATGDIPVAGDFTGDGKTDIAFFRPSTGFWFILRSDDSSFFSFPFGAPGDVPLVGDFDGDHKIDPAVFRPSTLTWFISKTTGGTTIATFGATGDKPVPKDYDGDGKTDIAIFRPSVGEWWYNRSSDGVTFAAQFGNSNDKPVPGDFTGDGKADLAFFRPSTGFWFVARSEDSSFFSFPFGTSTDLPVPGDYDGDGKYDSAVFRPSTNTWFINATTAGVQIVGFGAAGDIPVPNYFVP